VCVCVCDLETLLLRRPTTDLDRSATETKYLYFTASLIKDFYTSVMTYKSIDVLRDCFSLETKNHCRQLMFSKIQQAAEIHLHVLYTAVRKTHRLTSSSYPNHCHVT
jgi:hypothetical protein